MIIGVGIDIVRIKRFEKWKQKIGLIERYFHPQEIDDSRRRGTGEIFSLAVRFAAKEAFGKALGQGLRGIKLKDIQIQTNESGKPDLLVYDTAKTALQLSGAEKIFVSLSHEKDNAIAIVILEK